MYLGYIYLLLYCVGGSMPQKLKKSKCNGATCLHLYNIGNNNKFTWKQAYKACTDLDQEMLRIETSEMQSSMDNLLRESIDKSQYQIWLAGQQSDQVTWKYMNGTAFTRQDITEEEYKDQNNCLYVKLWRTGHEYFTEKCESRREEIRLLCQYEPSADGKCQPNDSNYKGKCYAKTLYDGTNRQAIDWYNGETNCSERYTRGDIAYSYLDDDSLINSIMFLVAGGEDTVKLWFGARRRPWFWITGSINNKHNEYIHYFNWKKLNKFDNRQKRCIYLDHKKNNKWYTEDCSLELSNYIVCMNVTGTTTDTIVTTTMVSRGTSTSSSITTVTSNTTTGTTPTTTATNSTTTAITAGITSTTSSGITAESAGIADTNKDHTDPPFKLVYVAPVIIGVIVLIVITAVTAFCVGKRRQRKLTEDVSETSQISSSSRRDIFDTKLPDVVFTASAKDVTEDNDISPYAEIRGTEQRVAIGDDAATAESTTPEKHPLELQVLPSGGGKVHWYKQAPSGDLYALSNNVDTEHYDVPSSGAEGDENKATISRDDDDEAKEIPETDK